VNSFLLFFINQKRFALVFTVLIISIGLLSLTSIQKDQLPAVDLEVVSIVTSYPGASPEDVEQNITNPIEDELMNIAGIEKFSSTSKEGRSAIVVTLSQDVDDITTLKQEIKDAVNKVRSLPDEVVDLPSFEVELNFSMPAIFINSSSIGLVIFCSTSSGEAPG
jgi:multidrug efflux pump subunit AcrB